VCWVVGLLPGGQVAAGIGAIGGSDIQRIVVVDVALRAASDFPGGRQLVRIGERKAGGGMVEGGVRPGRSVVTLRALRSGEARGNVIRYVAT